MKSAFTTSFVRLIASSLGRFLALAGIVALGAGFYAGLRMTAPDMRLAADAFYDGTNLMDVRVVSTLGMDDDDIAALRAIEGVSAVMPAYETDILGEIDAEEYAMRVHSLPPSASKSVCADGVTVASDDDAYINRLVLEEGRWPAAPGECVVSADSVTKADFAPGDTIEVRECSGDIDSTLTVRTLTVVGTVHASYYTTSTSLGTTSIGSGSIAQVVYVGEDTFADSFPYTEAFLTVEGASRAFASDKAYKAAVAPVVSRIEQLAPSREKARTETLRAQADEALDSARTELERERALALDALGAAAAELASAQAQIEEGEAAHARGAAALAEGERAHERQRAAAQEEFARTEQELAAAREDLLAGAPAIEAIRDAVELAWDAGGYTYESAAETLSSYAALIEEDERALAALREDRPEDLDQIAALEAKLDAERKASEALGSLIEGKRAIDAYDQGMREVADGQRALEAARAEADSRFAAARAELDAASDQIAQGRSELDHARDRAEEGRSAFEAARRSASDELESAEREIARAAAAADDMPAVQWYVMDRDKNVGVVSFDADAGRIDSIASVFPLIFFLVAALVALTTMTRMVEEERVIIGTYKALGYSKARISSKYLAYAGLASGIGALAGIALLSRVLPWVIQNAYGIMYVVPIGPVPLHPPIAIASFAAGVGVTLAATLAAVMATLSEKPASLMLPRSPKAGKRILLERIAPVWSRFSFTWKVTARNLFRYKKRLVMTLIGIAGCTALLLTGLGLSNAINDIIDNQFGRITIYNTVVSMEDDAQEALAAVEREFDASGIVSGRAKVESRAMFAESAHAPEMRMTLVSPEDAATFDEFVFMKPRCADDPIAFFDDSVVVTEKLASRLGVGEGDAITLAASDAAGNATEETCEVVVTDVMENYIDDFVFMGRDAYERAWGRQIEPASVLAIAEASADARASLAESVREIDGVKTMSYNDETIDTYRKMIGSVNIIVVVLVVAAAGLAFIVLYNLTNINITERSREIATLKVLGFTAREVQSYIFREALVLSVLGALIGLVLGVFLEGFVVATAEVDQVMFGRAIHPMSFVAGFALTMAFTVIVLFAMRGKLARIDMVESLKSVE